MNEMLDAMKEGLEENLKEVAEDVVEEAASKCPYTLDDVALRALTNSDSIEALENKITDISNKVDTSKADLSVGKVVGISAGVSFGMLLLGVGGYFGYKYALKPWLDKKKAPKEDKADDVVADVDPVEE